MNTATKNVEAKTATQHGQQSNAYMRTPGESVTGNVEYAIKQTKLGQILVATTSHGICAILFGDDQHELVENLSKHLPDAILRRDDATIQPATEKVVKFIEAPFGVFDAPLDIGGTLFQQQVWRALREIPAGQTLSYADVALKIGRPTAVRAVAGACAANAIAVAIPCHRVVRNDGTISGYRWGTQLKMQLLGMEAQA